MKNIILKTKNTVSVLFYAVTVSLVFLLASCGEEHKHDDEHGEEKEDHEEVQNEVSITPAQYKQLGVELVAIQSRNLTDLLKSTGVLKVPPQNKASVNAVMGGTVQSILVQEGDFVQKGQTVATLANTEFIKLQEDYLNAAAQITFAEAEYNRQKELSEKNVSAQKTFQQSKSTYESLKAKISSLSKQLALLNISVAKLTNDNIASHIAVTSPISGHISHIDINIGKTVTASEQLMDVVDNAKLHLDIFIFEQDLPKISIGQKVDVILTNLSGKNYSAKIFAIGSAFEGGSKTIPVHAEITGDKKGLIEGMNVTALISTSSDTVPSVPDAAIINFGGNDYIFIETHNHKPTDHEHKDDEPHDIKEEMGDVISFQRVQVKKGISESGFTQIVPLTEIEDGAKVVTNGIVYLMAMLTNEGGHHEH